MTKHYLYVFTNEGVVIDKGLVTLSADGWVLETDTPIEDYGDYLLAPEPTTTPWEDWMKGCE